MKVAFLGTGLMGAPMVRNLVAAGQELHIWNRTKAKAEALANIARVHDTATAAMKNVDVVVMMLADGPVTREVMIDRGVMAAAADNTLFINMGSVDPATDIALAKRATAEGKRYLDAPVSGGVKGAVEASLTIFVGGKEHDFRSAEPLLQIFGRPNHLGDVGAGQTAKLANQLIVAITIGAVAEAFKLAESAGCDSAVLQKALQGGFADSRILEQHGERMVKRDFEPGGRSRSQLKDIDNALALARDSVLNLPLASVAADGFRSLVEQYDGGELDHSAYYWWLEQLQKS
jgi:2-hydroxy-3-oxopropionate reductase